MKTPDDRIERLISRCLDGECSSAQRRELDAELRRDPDVQVLYEEHRALDHEIRNALRESLGDSRFVRLRAPLWQRTARFVAVATAACLAFLVWLSPPVGDRSTARQAPTIAGAPSWFSASPAGDVLVNPPNYFATRRVKSQSPRTRLILVPTEKRGEYLVIEVDNPPMRAVRIEEEF